MASRDKQDIPKHSMVSDYYVHPVSMVRALKTKESLQMDDRFQSLLYHCEKR